jgi:hypothetical protein
MTGQGAGDVRKFGNYLTPLQTHVDLPSRLNRGMAAANRFVGPERFLQKLNCALPVNIELTTGVHDLSSGFGVVKL